MSSVSVISSFCIERDVEVIHLQIWFPNNFRILPLTGALNSPNGNVLNSPGTAVTRFGALVTF
jgi:hypothetical protein